MVAIINPFDAGGFTLTEMTRALQILPNQYGLIQQLGLFRREGITQRSVMIESVEGVLNLLPSVALGAPATVGNRDGRYLRSFTVPWVPHNDVIVPQDIQGIRSFDTANGLDPLTAVMTRKLSRMRNKHAQTLEYMMVNAMRGVTKDGAGSTVYNWHTEFGTTQNSTDLVLGTSTTDVPGKLRTAKRDIEVNLKGETMTGALCLCGPSFFDALTKHDTVKDAYKFYAATNGGSPLREDLRDGFYFQGIKFVEYNATVTLADGTTTERLIPDAEAILFPLGTEDTFVTYFSPGNFMEAVNTIGQELYARQIARQDGSGIDVLTEASPLPMVKRPRLIQRLHTSN